MHARAGRPGVVHGVQVLFAITYSCTGTESSQHTCMHMQVALALFMLYKLALLMAKDMLDAFQVGVQLRHVGCRRTAHCVQASVFVSFL